MAVVRLLRVGVAGVLHPLLKRFAVLFENQKLPQNHVSLVVSGLDQTTSKHFANSGEFRDRLVTHGFGHEIFMLLRRARHDDPRKHLLGVRIATDFLKTPSASACKNESLLIATRAFFSFCEQFFTLEKRFFFFLSLTLPHLKKTQRNLTS